MRKNSKIVWLWLSVCLLILGLVSCKNADSNNSGGTTAGIYDNIIYSRDVNATLILGDGVETDDINSVRTAYYRTLGKEIKITAASEAAPHEIIIGKTDRPLSKKAYRYLSLCKKEEKDVGYVIYSDEKSVAIAFDEASFGENVAFTEAIRQFVSNYMQKDSLKLSSGAVSYDSFDPIEKQQQIDEANTEKLWELKLSQISTKVGDEEAAALIIKELKAFRQIYNQEHNIVKWLANLYDPETGGFYYSNSARNNQGYLPDLESTSGAIGIVESILMGYGGTLTDYFGEEIADRFVSFAKDMQQSNGYFYHPQWTPKLIDANPERRTRDLLNALNILEYFGASPVYDTPNGIKGEGTAAPVAMLVAPLGTDHTVAVSQLVRSFEDEIYIPAHLKSQSEFEKYLRTLDIRSDPVNAAKKMYSELSLYIAVDEILEERGEDYRLCSTLIRFLDNTQSSSGLWNSSGIVTNEAIDGFLGIVKIYNALGELLPRYDAVVNTLMIALNFSDEPSDISKISAVWSAFAATVNNMITFGSEKSSEDIDYCLSRVYAKLGSVLKTTGENLALFRRSDGSFSTTPTGSASEVLGMPVAVPLMEEGDVSATLIATNSIWLAIFKVLDIGNVPIFTTSDRMMFQKTLSDLGVIIKNEVKETPPLDFEGDDIGEAGSDVSLVIKSTYGTKSEIVAGGEEHGNVLRLYSPPDEKASSSDEFNFAVMSEVKSASCFSLKLDMCVTNASSGDNFAQLLIAKQVYAIGLNLEGDTIRFFEETSARAANSYTQDLGIRAKLGEWFTLRVEYYPGTAETVRIKIYFSSETVKEKLVAVTDNYYDYDGNKYNGAGVPKIDCSGFAVHGLWGQEMDVLIDNLVIEKTYKAYTIEDSPTLNRNIDTIDTDPNVYDFESANIGSLPSGFEVGGEGSAVSVITDEDNNKLLSVSEGAGEIILPLEQISSKVNSALIEFDIVIPEDVKAGAKYQISFNEYLCSERTFGAIQLLILEEDGVKYGALAEVVSGKTGAVYSAYKLYTNEEYRLSFRLFFEENSLVVSIGGRIAGISSNVLAGCKKYYMGETAIKALTPEIKSTILIDDLISARVRSNYEELTKPDTDRVTNTFDTENAEGVELKGVSPSDGTLSFNGAGTNKEVKIPVITRVEVPTMALIGFDVKTVENSSGSLKISFTDNSGKNIIAVFSLVLKGSAVEIYEHTKNGRYVTPIHRVNSTEFNFSIEYSAEKESFNLLIDGEYIAASSVIYTFGSGAYAFEYLSIGTETSAGFIIDNLYAEKSYGTFSEHKVSMENTDSTSSVITYETSSFASLPTNITRTFGSMASYFKIRVDNVKGNVSKVLEFYTDSSAADYTVFQRTATQEGANAAFFESDMMLKMLDGKRLSAELCFQAQVSGTPTVYTFNIIADTEGGVLKIKGTGIEEQAVTVKESEWFTLRLEYCDTGADFDYDGQNDYLFRVYIDGIQIGKDLHRTKVYDYDKLHRLRLAAYSGVEGKIYLDNTSLGQCTSEFNAPIQGDTDTITNNPGIVTSKTVFTLGSKDSSASVVDMNEMSGQVGKVLKFYSAKNSPDKLEIAVTQTLDGATGITFETDIMISPESGTSVFYLEPVTADGKQPFRLTIKATAGGDVTLTNPQNYGEEIPLGKSGEWIRLRVDYMNPRVDYDGDRRADLLYKIYVGEGEDAELLATGYRLYKAGAYYDPAELTDYVFTVTQASDVNIYLDNTSFRQVKLIPDKAPEFDYSEEDTYGESGSDDSAWTA